MWTYGDFFSRVFWFIVFLAVYVIGRGFIESLNTPNVPERFQHHLSYEEFKRGNQNYIPHRP